MHRAIIAMVRSCSGLGRVGEGDLAKGHLDTGGDGNDGWDLLEDLGNLCSAGFLIWERRNERFSLEYDNGNEEELNHADSPPRLKQATTVTPAQRHQLMGLRTPKSERSWMRLRNHVLASQREMGAPKMVLP